MRVKDIQDENFQDYKKTSIFIATCFCNWKCCYDIGMTDASMCQNSTTAKLPTMNIADEIIVNKYINNPITKAIVIGGLEPFEQYDELDNLIKAFRKETQDDIVIYTGFREDEIFEEVTNLKRFDNIIIKFGRYRPNDKSIYDEVLGITLASSNQYAKRIS